MVCPRHKIIKAFGAYDSNNDGLITHLEFSALCNRFLPTNLGTTTSQKCEAVPRRTRILRLIDFCITQL